MKTKSKRNFVFGARDQNERLIISICPFCNFSASCSLASYWGSSVQLFLVVTVALATFRFSGCLVLVLIRGFDCETYKTKCWFPSQEHLLKLNRESKGGDDHMDKHALDQTQPRNRSTIFRCWTQTTLVRYSTAWGQCGRCFWSSIEALSIGHDHC